MHVEQAAANPLLIQDRGTALAHAAALENQRRRIPFVLASVLTTLIMALLEHPGMATPVSSCIVLLIAAVTIWWFANYLQHHEARKYLLRTEQALTGLVDHESWELFQARRRAARPWRAAFIELAGLAIGTMGLNVVWFFACYLR